MKKPIFTATSLAILSVFALSWAQAKDPVEAKETAPTGLFEVTDFQGKKTLYTLTDQEATDLAFAAKSPAELAQFTEKLLRSNKTAASVLPKISERNRMQPTTAHYSYHHGGPVFYPHHYGIHNGYCGFYNSAPVYYEPLELPPLVSPVYDPYYSCYPGDNYCPPVFFVPPPLPVYSYPLQTFCQQTYCVSNVRYYGNTCHPYYNHRGWCR